jgi:UDP-N-acetylmuramate dehydrogenase
MYLLSEGILRVEAGVTCAKVAKFCTKNALKDAAFLAGIPGTMGGALAMNAGAFGGETWNIVSKVETMNRRGQISVRDATSFEVGYRSVKMPAQTWFVAAHLKLTPGDTSTLENEIKALLAKRALTQPIGLPSCGSVFRNPPDDYAARLIESAGLKGHMIGGAQVSLKHANFIINTGTATAADIEALIHWVEAQVLEKTGVKLIREVKIIGEP